jgi:hypothetical protein
MPLVVPFAGPDGTGMLIALFLGTSAISHVVAGALGFFLTRRTWWRPIPLLLVALVPMLLFSIWQVQDAWYLNHQAVYDRFRENVVDPIPASVADLQFISLGESHSADLMFRFTISPEDLSNIIRMKGFREIKTNEFRQPNDLFTHPEYLPLGEPATYYIINDIEAGYPEKGIGEGYTLKVSADRKVVVFRRESAAYYLYKYWESGADRSLTQDFLNSLGQHTAHKTTNPATTGQVP